MKIQIKAHILEWRLYVCVFAYIATFIGSILLAKDIWHIPLIYIILAIFFDQMSRFIVPSPIDEKDLSEKYKITQDQLNTYVKSKRNYRVSAAGIATIIALYMSAFNYKFSCYFVGSYIILWGFYPLYRMFILKIPAAKIFKLIQEEFKKREGTQHHTFDDRSYDPLKLGTLGWQVNRTQELSSLHAQRNIDLR